MKEHEKINYIEFPSRDLPATRRFFTQVFGWTFVDYGVEYTTFEDQGIDGGFYKAELLSSTSNGAALIIFYSRDLEATQQKIISAGGSINKATYSFPGGRRFHFTEPSGNEFAVWSDVTN
jgi:uncharacterized protein